MRILLALAVILSGCPGETTPGGGCDSNSACQPGEACIDDACLKLCTSDRDCGGDAICENDTCVTGTREDLPIIEGIEADGSVDDDPAHVGQRIASHLTILGQHFEGANVRLADGDSTWDLDLCTAESDRLVVAMPTDLAAGTYTLTVVSQAGACDANLPVLQGEVGPQGPAGPAGVAGPTGPQGPPGPVFTGAGAAGAIVSSLTVSARGDCGGVAPVEHMAVYLNQALTAEFDVSNASYADFTVPIATPVYADEITVAFTNDNHAGDCDHNLRVQHIVINGTTTIPATDATTVIMDRGDFFDRVDVVAPDSTLSVNSALRFFISFASPRRAPRYAWTRDARGDCPPAASAAGEPLISQTIDLASRSVVHVNSHIISLAIGRRDARLNIDGTNVSHDLVRTETNDWADHELFWVGSLAAGSHAIEIRAGTDNVGYGCGGPWGHIGTLIFEP